jgi:FkbM family methyltransferase
LFKHEFVDLLLPTFRTDFDYSTMESYFIEGPYELNKNICLHKGDVVFDCGANMGVFSAIASTKGCAKVISFEPSELIRKKYLDELAKEYAQIVVAPFALSDHIGETVFTYNTVNIGAPSIMEKNENVDIIEEKVNLITIDEYVKQNNIEKVDFIKADIEGAERSMLLGAKYVLQTFAPILSICTYHQEDDKEVLEKMILDINSNYVIEQKYMKLYAYVPKE